jgi:hypothetical protein
VILAALGLNPESERQRAKQAQAAMTFGMVFISHIKVSLHQAEGLFHGRGSLRACLIDR